jgi:16S rRNA G966 N2-methylase RsmD
MPFDKQLLNDDVQDFIIQNSTNFDTQLAFKKNPFSGVNYSEILLQVHARIKAQYKLPTWFKSAKIIYPSTVSLQQTSSELTAKYKAGLVSGDAGIDLTGGFGVDSFFFAKRFDHFYYVDRDEVLCQMVEHNFEVLNSQNIKSYHGESTEILKNLQQRIDFIYLDPARRDQNNKKVFRFEDCEPDVVNNLLFYFEKANQILIKSSPLLDLDLACSQLKWVRSIHVVAVDHEVKEILFLLEKNFQNQTEIHAIDLTQNLQISFNYRSKSSTFDYELPLKFLYLPHPSLMKIGQFEVLEKFVGLKKLHQNSHLFTANECHADFYGKVYKINECLPYQKNCLKSKLTNKKMNIACRNFPIKPEQLSKLWKIKDGGEDYVFFTTNKNNEKIVLFCTKL